MKKLNIAFLVTMFAAAPLFAQTAAITNYCVLGATQANTSGLKSFNYLQGIIPQCTVTVYLTGTTTLATIYANTSNTALTNPFTAHKDGSWLFFAAVNQGYDVVLSGGIKPNNYPAPVTLTGVFPSTQYGGVAGSGTAGYIPVFTGTNSLGNSVIDQGVTNPGAVTVNDPMVVGGSVTAGSLVLNTPLRSLFTSGTLSNKKIIYWGNSTVSGAVEWFQEMAQHCGPGDALDGFTCSPEIDGQFGGAGGYFPLQVGNIYNYGNSGATLSSLIAGYGYFPLSSVISASPDLLLMRGPLINDVRNGACNLSCAEGLLTTALNTITTSIPNTQVLLETENSLLTTDPGSYGFITSVSTTETLVDGGSGGVTSAGSHVITVASMPDSIYPGPMAESGGVVPFSQVIVNNGGSDQETVDVTQVSGNTFTAIFSNTHTNGFSVIATVATAAQAYSYILRQAVLNMRGRYTNVAVFDVQQALYGTIAPPTSPFMLNSLHPGPSGRIVEADLVADFLLKVRNGNAATPVPPGTVFNKLSSDFVTGLTIGSSTGTGVIPLAINGAAGSVRAVEALTNGSYRWLFGADGSSETGSNSGSDFIINAYSDTGAPSQYLDIKRATGLTTFSGPVQINNVAAVLGTFTIGSNTYVPPNGISGPIYNAIVGKWRAVAMQTAGSFRWLEGANNTPESGSNAGSDYDFRAYSDTGGYLGDWLVINRATGAISISNLTPAGCVTNTAAGVLGTKACGAAVSATTPTVNAGVCWKTTTTVGTCTAGTWPNCTTCN